MLLCLPGGAGALKGADVVVRAHCHGLFVLYLVGAAEVRR